MRAVWRDIDAVLAAILPAGEPLVVSDVGVVRGETAGLGRTGLFAQLLAMARELVVVGITVRTIAIVPVVAVRGPLARGCRRRLVRRGGSEELLPRDAVIVERGDLDRRAGHLVVPVRFVRHDGSALLVEMHGDPRAWTCLAI